MSELSLLGRPARYATGLEDLGAGLFAWLQPNGDVGESNAGLVVGDNESLLIDTLWDRRLTGRMLDAMAPRTVGAPIRRLVNTHGDPDHCWGNQLLAGAEIIATRATAQDVRREDPRQLRMLGRLAGALDGRRLPLPGAGKLAGLGAFAGMLRAYDFSGITVTPPTLTFQGTLELDVGGRRVVLIEVGPAHTPGDLIVHVPDSGVVYAGDLMFVGVTPIMWVGPVENWIAGLQQIIDLEPKVVVPGHGPLTDIDGVREMQRYWEFVAATVRARVSRGVSPSDCAGEIVRSLEFAAQPFASWDAPARIAVNAAIIARGDRGEGGSRVSSRTRMGLIAQMGELARELAT